MKKAFTLIEVLIVIAILSILAAIAIPGFMEAKRRVDIQKLTHEQYVAKYGQDDPATKNLLANNDEFRNNWKVRYGNTDQQLPAENPVEGKQEVEKSAEQPIVRLTVDPQKVQNNVLNTPIISVDPSKCVTVNEPLSGNKEELDNAIKDSLKAVNKTPENDVILVVKENFTYRIYYK